MNTKKVEILEKAISIIQHDINDDLYDWLLDWTDARPNDTAYFLNNIIDGLRESFVAKRD